jgi:hypothetical protein
MTNLFTAKQFTATKFASPEKKAHVANSLIAFLADGCPRKKFTPTLYRAVSNMWGHMAEGNIEGFWQQWFSTPGRIYNFCLKIVGHEPCGDPAYTFSDVERAVGQYLSEGDFLETPERLKNELFIDIACRANTALRQSLMDTARGALNAMCFADQVSIVGEFARAIGPDKLNL